MFVKSVLSGYLPFYRNIHAKCQLYRLSLFRDIVEYILIDVNILAGAPRRRSRYYRKSRVIIIARFNDCLRNERNVHAKCEVFDLVVLELSQ